MSAAITALNTSGVSGPVTFNVAAGYTETALNLTLTTATTTATNTITFQKSGAGANPLLTAATTGAGNYDGVIRIEGTDYVTFDGIDIAADQTAGLTIAQRTEFGYGVFAASATNAAQNIIIRNCTVTGFTGYYNTTANIITAGILLDNTRNAAGTAVTPTAATGAISNCDIYNNTVTGWYNGIYLKGVTTAAYYGQNNRIGSLGANTITNIGGSTAAVNGIYTIYQAGLKIENNSVTGSTPAGSGVLSGILADGANTNNAFTTDINLNTVNLTMGGTNTIAPITNKTGATTITINGNTVSATSATSTAFNNYMIQNNAVGGTINITNNTVQNLSLTALATSGFFMAIYNSATPIAATTISGNTVANCTINYTTSYLIRNDAYNASLVLPSNVFNNIIHNITFTATAPSVFMIWHQNQSVNIHDNHFYTIACPSATSGGSIIGAQNTIYASSLSFYNNVFNDITFTGPGSISGTDIQSGGAPGTIYGNQMYNWSSTANGTLVGLKISGSFAKTIYKNKVYNLNGGGGTATVAGIQVVQGTATLYDNFVSDLRVPSGTNVNAVKGFDLQYASSNAYNNTIYLDCVTPGAGMGSTAINTTSVMTLDLRNNILINNSVPGAGGKSVVLRAAAAAQLTLAATCDRNNLYAGAPSAQNLLYSDGTTDIQDISSYKTFAVAPKEANSFSENTPFVNVATAPYDLHVNTASPTQCESGGARVTTPIAVTDDIDGDLRWGETGYTGTGTAPDVGADEFNGTGPVNMAYVSSTTTQNTGVAYASAPATILGIQVVMSAGRQVALTQLDFTTTGTTSVADITDAKVYCSLGVNAFSSAIPFGTVVTAPNGAFSVVGNQLLYPGTNYFWLVYDVAAAAPTGNIVDATCSGVTVNAVLQTPTVTAPAGSLTVQGPISGVKTIGPAGDYPSIANVITILNNAGVGTGGVTLNVPAGYTETASNLVLSTPTSSATSPIVFQKSGVGADPVVTASTGTGTMDGIVIIAGTNYVTFDGIDLQENPANTTATQQMEWGYAILKASATAASQNVTIKNCTITLTSANPASTGIYSGNHTAANTTQLVITTASGTMSNCKFYSNTLTNLNAGIALNGYASPTSPYAFYDQSNEIGNVGFGNTVSAFGGASAAAYGFYATNQNLLTIANNTVNGTTAPAAAAVYGIYAGTGLLSNASITNNTVTVQGSATTATLTAIRNDMGGSGATNTVTITGNLVADCLWPAGAFTANFYGVYQNSTAKTVTVSNNIVRGANLGGTQNFTGISVATAAATTVLGVQNNVVSFNQKTTGASGTFTGITLPNAVSTVSGNTITSNSTASTGGIIGLTSSGSSGSETMYNNLVQNLTSSVAAPILGLSCASTGGTSRSYYGNTIDSLSSAGGSVIGATFSGTTPAAIYKNSIHGLSSGTTTGSVTGMLFTASAVANVYNNVVNDLTAPAAAPAAGTTVSVTGISSGSATTLRLFYNTVFLNAASTGATFTTAGMVMAATTTALDMRNNNIVNVSTPGASGFTIAFKTAGAMTSYAATSDRNNFHAGTPSATNLIFHDGTNALQTISAYRTLVAPRDFSSFSENPPFVNVATLPYDLHIGTVTPTYCESGGVRVTTPIAVTDDYAGSLRQGETGYVGTGTAPDVGAYEFAGTPVAPMTVVSSTTTQAVTTTVMHNTLNNQIIGVEVVMSAGSSVPLTAITFNTTGTTLPADIANARLYFTYGSNVFATTYPLGVQAAPNGTYTITTTQPLMEGTNYFWLAYDVALNAATGHLLDAECTTMTIGGTAVIPTVTAPVGSRAIQGPVAGVMTIGPGGDFATFADAFTMINAQGVGAAGVTFNVAAGYTESALNLTLNTTSSTVTSPIVFQKSGAGANPVITALYTGAGNYDGVIRIEGTDYVTFDGIDVAANPTLGLTVAQRTEFGYGVFAASATNAAQNITIKNCTVTGFAGYYNTTAGIYTAGILLDNTRNAAGTAVAPTAATGVISNCDIYNNTVTGWYNGIYVKGYATAAYYGLNNHIGSLGANTITNIGGSTAAVNGIYTIYQAGLKIENNAITGSVPSGSGVLTGILADGANSNSATTTDINTNTVNLTMGGTTTVAPISNKTGAATININGNTVSATSATSTAINNYMIQNSAIGGTINLQNNTVQNVSLTAAASATLMCIYNSSSPTVATNISGNTVVNCTTGYSSNYFIRNDSYTSAPSNVFNNTIHNMTFTGLAPSVWMIWHQNYNINIHDNHFYAITFPGATSGGTLYGAQNTTMASSYNFYNNVFNDITYSGPGSIYGTDIQSGGAPGTIYGNQMYNWSSTTNGTLIGMKVGGAFAKSIYKNTVYNLNGGGGTATVTGIQVVSGTATLYDNLVSNLRVPNGSSANAVKGVDIQSASSNVYYNTIYLDGAAAGATMGSTGINTSGIMTLDLRNNHVINKTVAGTGKSVALRAAAAAQLTLAATCDRNNLYAGIPGANNLLFSDGTNNLQTIASYQTFAVAPREAGSFSENTSFVNTTTPPYDLHQNTGVNIDPLPAGSNNGTPVTGITTDFDNIARDANHPDVGAYEYNVNRTVTGTGVLSFPSGTLENLTINATGATVTMTGPLTLYGVLTLSAGAFNLNGFTLTMDNSIVSAGGTLTGSATSNLTVNNTGAAATLPAVTLNNLTVNSPNGVVLAGDVTVDGALTLTSGAVTIGANTLTLMGGMSSTGGTLVGGPTSNLTVAEPVTPAAQLTLPAITVNNLTVNRAAGVALGGNVVAEGVLTLTNGLVTLGASNLTLGPAASIGGTPSVASMIVASAGVGEVRKEYTGIGTFTYPVGDVTGTPDYTPITVNFTGGTFGAGAYAGITLANAQHPFMPASTNYLTRYWHVTQTGITGFTCDVTGTYVPADVVGSEAGMVTGKWNGTSWTGFTAVNAATHQIGATGVTSFSDFSSGPQSIMNGTVKYVVRPKVMLEGAWNGVSAMRTDLRTGAFLPLTQPYNDVTRWNYAGTEAVAAIPAGVVDWVLVETRDAVTPATVVARRAAFLLSDGTITDLDGVSPVGMTAGVAGNYYIVVRHRNHIPVMSAAAQALSLSVTGTTYNFTTGQAQAFGTLPMKQIAAGVFALFGGDATGDGFVDGNDFNSIDANQWNAGYLLYDVNLDGFIDGNDYNLPDANQWQGTQVP